MRKDNTTVIGRLIPVLLFWSLGGLLWGQSGVTVAEVEAALRRGSHRSENSDRKMAARLADVRLTEQLSEDRFAALVAETQPGEKTVEQLRMVMDASMLMPPPKDEIADAPAPDAEAQRVMIERAQAYVRNTLRHLPDFLATRETQSFNASSMIGVWYGPVTIGEKVYVCPVRSVAVSRIRNSVTTQWPVTEFTRYVNEVRFLKYRKFGSEERVVPVE